MPRNYHSTPNQPLDQAMRKIAHSVNEKFRSDKEHTLSKEEIESLKLCIEWERVRLRAVEKRAGSGFDPGASNEADDESEIFGDDETEGDESE